jgi:hypothetical protein
MKVFLPPGGPVLFFQKKKRLLALFFAYCWRSKKGRGCRLSPA